MEHRQDRIYATVMLCLALLGLVVNVASIVLIGRRKKKSMFHTLLKILAIYDLIVMLGCVSLYSLPDLWVWFSFSVYPYALPWLVPLVQIAMMTSVYCTIVMSFERYIRICHICQLKSSRALSEDNFWCYVTGFVVVPILFYLPKFFEISTISTEKPRHYIINCTVILDGFDSDGFEDPSLVTTGLPPNISANRAEELFTVVELCQLPANSSSLDPNIRNLTRFVPVLEIQATALRKNRWYYKIYCIGLNILFGSLIPLMSLIYLNICTVLALRRMSQNSGLVLESPPHWKNSSSRSPPVLRAHAGGGRRSGQSSLENESTRARATTASPGTEDANASRSASVRRLQFKLKQQPGVDDSSGQSLYVDEEVEETDLFMEVTELEEDSEEEASKKKNKQRILFKAAKLKKSRQTAKDRAAPTRSSRVRAAKPAGDKSAPSIRIVSLKGSGSATAGPVLRKQENRLTRISLSIVSLFVVCHVWRIVPTAYEALFSEDGTVLTQWPDWLKHIHDISHTLIVFNSAVNFLLYVVW